MKNLFKKIFFTICFIVVLTFAGTMSLCASNNYTIPDVTQVTQTINVEKGHDIICNSPSYVVDVCEIDGNAAYVNVSGKYVESFTLNTDNLAEGMHKVVLSYYYTQNVRVFSESKGWTYEKVKSSYAGSNGFIINITTPKASADSPLEGTTEDNLIKVTNINTENEIETSYEKSRVK